MKAAIYRRYGPPDVLDLTDVPTPVPGDDDVLIRIHATTVTAADHRLRSLDMPAGFGLISRLIFGMGGPKQPILGSELSGVVESVGKSVVRFRPGDEVFAFNGAGLGCHAEFKAMPQHAAIAAKPAALDFPTAAALSFGGTTALSFLRRAGVGRGDAVLINGASGAVGSAAVQLARHFGAHVTGVCSGANAEQVRSIGADTVIDYTRDDFARNRQAYDVVLDATGTLSASRCRPSLRKGGRLALVVASLPQMLSAPWITLSGGPKIVAGPATATAEDLRFLADLAERGEFQPVIDRHFPFAQIRDAHRHVDTGRKRGNVIVRIV